MDILKSFLVFRTTAELGSFSKAAERLGIVPSAVSRQINELENWAGVRLINRTTRSLNLTAEGRVYLEKTGQIATDVDDLRSLSHTGHSLSGHINLTAPNMLGQFVLPGILADFRRAHPSVSISVTMMSRKVDIVKEGFDLAIRGGELPDSTFVSRTVGHIDLSTVASPDYLAQNACLEKPADLSAHNCLLNDPQGQTGRWPFQVDGKEILVKVHGDLSANDPLYLKGLALGGLGIARMPRSYLVNELERRELVEILPDQAPKPTPIHILHHSRQHVRPALRALVECLAHGFRQPL